MLNIVFKYKIIAFLLLVVVFVLSYAVFIITRGELSDKPVYAALQGIELNYRNKPQTNTPVMLKNASNSIYDFLGIPSNNTKHPYVWLVLNEVDTKGKIMVMPKDSSYSIDCSYLKELVSNVSIHPSVKSILESTCSQ